MRIRTSYIDFVNEWQAIDSDTYDAEYKAGEACASIEGSWSSSSPMGMGKTEAEAIEDLVTQIQERGIDLG